MTRYKRELNRAMVGAILMRLEDGWDVAPGDSITYEHRFGDEGPGSYTRGTDYATKKQIADAERMLSTGAWF